MTKTKTTKRALLSSVIALLLCFAMLLGTTFAWFTDSVTSANNVIQSGNLDIELDYWDGDSWETIEGTSSLFTGNLWEPGHTEVVYLKLSNLGSLALKYQLSINVLSETEGTNVKNETFKLSDYIQMGVVEDKNGETNPYAKDASGRAQAIAEAGETGIIGDGYAKQGNMLADADELYMAVVVYMPESVGNEANAKTGTDVPTINLGVQILATQYTAEGDSFDDQYDADAWMEGMQVYSAEDLQAAINNGEDVVLMDDITLTETIVIPAPTTAAYSMRAIDYTVINLNGKTITAADPTTDYAINNLGNLLLCDTVGDGSVNARGIYNGYDAEGNYVATANLVVENGTYNALGTDGGAAIFNYGIVTINGGEFTSDGGYSLNNRNTMTINDAVVTGGIYNTGALTINDGTIKTDRGGYTHAIYSSGGSIEVNDGTFSGNGNEVINANSDVAIINGGTFQKVEKTSYLMAGSNMVINGGTFLAHESNPAAHPVRPDVTVKGGTFNYQHTNIADGYKIVEYNGMYVVVSESAITTTEDLVTAINEGATEIELAPGSYTWPTSYNGSGVNTLQGKTLTVKGTRDAVIEMSHVDEKDQYVTGATLAFEGVTLNFGTTIYMGFANTASLTYKDCAINGLQCSGTNVVFEDCDLNSNGAEHCVWTWGAQNLTFTRCDFTYADRAVNCYGVLNITTKATFTDCTFNKVEGAETTGAIETNSSTIAALNLSINNCTVNEGDLWFIAGWDNKSGANTTATVDGVAEKGVVLVQSGVLPYLAINSNSTYELVGDFGGINVSLVMARGVENVIFDGSKATNINELIITQNGQLIDNATTAIGNRSGNVTVQNFNVLSQINVFACNTEAVVQNNTAEALMVYAGNCDVKVLNNIIDANFESHPTYKNATETWNTNNYGIALNIFNYNLWLDGNTVTDATGHAIGINGWEGTFDTNDYENKIESFKGNNITVNSTTNTKRAAFKVWDDETYASNDDDTNVVNDTTQAFINAVLADGSNTFNILEGYEHTIFSIYYVNTNN